MAPEALSTSYFTGSASFGISMMTLISSGGFLPVGTRSRPIAYCSDVRPAADGAAWRGGGRGRARIIGGNPGPAAASDGYCREESRDAGCEAVAGPRFAGRDHAGGAG